MFTQLLEDLRFFIGVFFLLVGLILTCAGLFQPTLTDGYNLNLITGLCFTVFALAALGLAVRGYLVRARPSSQESTAFPKKALLKTNLKTT